MKYAIIDTEKGESVGFKPLLHRLLQDGEKMLVNEKELKRIGDDIDVVAQNLGGETLTYSEMINLLNTTET